MRLRSCKYLKERKISRRSVRWLFQMTAPYKWKILGLILIRCILTVIGISMAVINKYIVDLATASLDMTASIALAVLCTGLSLAGALLLNVFIIRLTEQYAYHLRSRMYAHILQSSWRSRVEYHSEGVLSRLTSDVSAITDGVVEVSVSLVSTILQFVMAFFVLLQYDFSLAFFAAVTGPVIFIFSYMVGRRLKRVQGHLQQTEADYRVFLQEQMSNADVVKAFEKETDSLNKLDKLQRVRMRWVEEKNRWTVLLRTGINLIFSGTYLLAFISGALKIAAGTITYGTMTAFLSLVGQVQAPVHSMSRILSYAIGVLASAGRVSEMAEMPTERGRGASLPELTSVGLCVENIHFSYNGEHRVFSGFSMRVEPGTLAVMMGPSGAGKTTLIRILLGFLSPTQGEVSYFDKDGCMFPCSPDTRKWVSYVPQGNTLFSGTIADNLKIGASDATEEQMRRALEMACAWEFVEGLPAGIHTKIGEKAHGLSEGQAQRIAIARALIRPAPLLILDEATSALDAETEKRILTHLRTRREGQTCLMICHRASVKSYADRVITLTQEAERQ